MQKILDGRKVLEFPGRIEGKGQKRLLSLPGNYRQLPLGAIELKEFVSDTEHSVCR